MEAVDLREAVLRLPTISDGCDLSTVVPPADGRHVVVDRWPQRLEHLRSAATRAPERLRPIAEHFLKVEEVLAPTQHWQILNLDDLMAEYGVGADFILEGLGLEERV